MGKIRESILVGLVGSILVGLFWLSCHTYEWGKYVGLFWLDLFGLFWWVYFGCHVTHMNGENTWVYFGWTCLVYFGGSILVVMSHI